MNCLSCADGVPKRVGVPKTKPSAQVRSSRVASGTSAVASRCATQPAWVAITSSGASSRTLRSRVSAPAAFAPSSKA